jgi:uncharacterized NAD(P)/FAD-binding protein YdhS
LAVADPLQLGVAARPDGRVLNVHGEVQPGLHAIGSLLRGNLWECTAMPEIRTAAHALAQALAAERPASPATVSAPAADAAPALPKGNILPFARHDEVAFSGFAGA